MTAVTERPSQADARDLDRARSRIRVLTAAVVILAVAVLGLGAWVIFGSTETQETAVSGEIETLLDDYYAAWNEYDAEAFSSVVTEDYVYEHDQGPMSAAGVSRRIEAGDAIELHVESLGEPLMVGDGPWYVAVTDRWTSTIYEEGGRDGFSLLIINDDLGTPLVESHVFLYEDLDDLWLEL